MNGVWQAGTDGLFGGFAGGMTGGFQAFNEGKNFWTGNVKNPYTGYYGIDINENIRYVGITSRDPEIRFNEHLESGTERAYLKYRSQKSDMTKINARIWEQNNINRYGLYKNNGLLYNKRNEIAPKYWEIYNIKPPKSNQFNQPK